MKYNYRTGVQKSLWERTRKIIWAVVTLFIVLMLFDMFFNNCQLFIKVLIWTW